MTLYDFVDSIWLGQVSSETKRLSYSACVSRSLRCGGGKDITDNLIACF